MVTGTDFETVIGIEVHAQLATRSKAFCACATTAEEPPTLNSRVCPVCLGLPGALPVYNRAALALAVRASLALGCTVQRRSIFARKNYFYADLPKGYQISQLEQPLALAGALHLGAGEQAFTVRIQRLHLEEDAGKLLHAEVGSRVDLDRAGVPLAEIVSEPDLRSAEQASAYLRELRRILLFAGVCDGNLEDGNFRADINLSLRPRGSQQLGDRVELKNINSFRFVERAIEFERERQAARLRAGERVLRETRGFDADTGTTFSMRTKEDDVDYRYFPDPDLPPLLVSDALIATERARLGEAPQQRADRYQRDWQISAASASLLTQHPQLAAFYDALVVFGAEPQRAANFLLSEVLGEVRFDGLHADIPLGAERMAGLLRMVADGSISGKQAKDLYVALKSSELDAAALADELGMAQLSDERELRRLAQEILAANPGPAASFRAGKTTMLGFFVGQMMRVTQKRANPEISNRILLELLSSTEVAS